MTLNWRTSYFGAVTAYEKPAGRPHISQTFAGKTLNDFTLVYNPTQRFSFSFGANNVFDVYPDKVTATTAAYSNGEIPYTRNANQFGFNGAYYYVNATVNF